MFVNLIVESLNKGIVSIGSFFTSWLFGFKTYTIAHSVKNANPSTSFRHSLNDTRYKLYSQSGESASKLPGVSTGIESIVAYVILHCITSGLFERDLDFQRTLASQPYVESIFLAISPTSSLICYYTVATSSRICVGMVSSLVVVSLSRSV